MKIFYVATLRLPTERAYGVNIAKTCEALARRGERVTLLAPKYENSIKEDFFAYYGTEKTFAMRYVPIVDAVNKHIRFGFWVNQFSYALSLLFGGHIGDKKNNVVLTRDEPLAGLVLALAGFRVFFDMHGFPERRLWFWRLALRRMEGIFTTNRWKRTRCIEAFQIPERNVAVAPNGFDPKLFDMQGSRKELRWKLGLPEDRPVVLYTGHLYDWKGAGVMLKAADFAEKGQEVKNALFVFVGGRDHDIEHFRNASQKTGNVLVAGRKPHRKIPLYLKAADVLILPNSQETCDVRMNVFSRYDTSPIKLFEYMASGTPVVASDLPSVREVLNDSNALLVEAGNHGALVRGIRKILQDADFAATIAKQALEDSKNYTWEKRAGRIVEFIKT